MSFHLFRLPRERRLSGRRSFADVFRARCSASDRRLVVYVLPNRLDHTRLGISVGRRYGSAVRRNRIKRHLREAFRLEADSIPTGFDVVCVPRKGQEADLDALRRSLRLVCVRAVARHEKQHDRKGGRQDGPRRTD